MKITKKSYKFGTYATTEYRVNGELIKEITEEKRNCGTSWFNDLPAEEDAEEIEVGRAEVPHEVDVIIDDMINAGDIPPALNQTKMETKLNDETINLKWYAIPPYNREGWRIFNEKGELVAVFEDRVECEHVVHLHNLTLDRIKPR